MIKLFALILSISLCGCQLGYIAKSAYHQARMLKSRVPIKKILSDKSVDASTKDKLRLAQDAKSFGEHYLKLKKTDNYNTYVDLKRPYVTYIVSAAPKNALTYHKWYFPIVGHVPYKGYFVKADADSEASALKKKNFDVYVRGVSAFSTLGWFNDPVLSSMMRYSDYNLVNTIIHETVHATLYISDNANFNERLATYLGDLGTRLFYNQKGPNGKVVLEKVKIDLADQKIFSEFISKELKSLEAWYSEHKTHKDLLTLRELEFKKIKSKFKREALAKMKGDRYNYFSDLKFNNALLLGYKLYVNDLSDFEHLTHIFKSDFKKILEYCISLADTDKPEDELKKFIAQEKNNHKPEQ